MSLRNHGLWLPTVRVEAEVVTLRHKKKCFTCVELPVGIRMVVTVGAARAAQQRVYCRECATVFIARRQQELRSLLSYLRGVKVIVRQWPFEKFDPSFHEKPVKRLEKV